MVALVVVGGSLGGPRALAEFLTGLGDAPPPVAVVQHVHRRSEGAFPVPQDQLGALKGRVARPGAALESGVALCGPPDYHLLIERTGHVSLSIDAPVRFSRPSIDVLFESAALAFGGDVAGVLLTGASEDGARGLRAIRDAGGLALVQDPSTAEAEVMPRAGLRLTPDATTGAPADLGRWLRSYAARPVDGSRR